MAHSNYAEDRDLMQEAYSSVQGTIPPTQSTAPARMLNESGCASHSDEEKITEIELGGDLYEVGGPDPSNESELIISIEKHSNGYMITTGEFSSPEDFVTKGPDSAVEAGGYALSLDGKLMEEDDLEDGLGHVEDAEDNEGESGFTSAQKEELEDIVHAVLNKREHEERVASHEDAEGEHAGYSVGDMIDGHDGEEIVTDVDVDGTIFTRELGAGGNKYTPEEINNLPS